MSSDNKKTSLFEELKRRNVYRVGLAYVVFTWLALQVIDTLGPILGLPDWAPRLVFTILAIGFPAVMLFAWAYELTPEGLKREKDVDRSESITGHTGQRLDRITIGVLLVTVGLLLIDKFFLTDTPAPQVVVQAEQVDGAEAQAKVEGNSPSIAVLPFVNMSADEDSAYFSDGLADTMLHMLAQVRDIRVAARTSSFKFRDQSLGIGEIGAQLNVSTILEGSVQRAGDKIRVTAQLIDVENGFHLWSGNFDRDLNDVFAIQDEIANEVVAALKVSLLGDVAGTLDRDQTDNLEAYTEYLLGLSNLGMQSTETLSKALAHLQEAVRLDPKYARAWSTLGRTYLDMEDYGMLSTREATPAARNAANRALDLVPESSEALAVLGKAELYDSNIEEGGNLLAKAIEFGPNDVIALSAYALYLSSDARPREALTYYEKAIALDPLSESAYIELSNLLMGVNELDEAEAVLARLRVVNPASPNLIGFQARLEARRGNYAAAIKSMKEAHSQDTGDPELPAMLGALYLAIDERDEARSWFGRAIEIDPEHPVSRSAPLFLGYGMQENEAETARLARELLKEEISNRRNARYMALNVLYEYSLKHNQLDLFLEDLDSLYPHLFDKPPTGLDKSAMATYFAGVSFYHNGETERGLELLRYWLNAEDRFEDVYGVSRTSVSVLWLLDDKDRALTNLQRLAPDKYYWELNPLLLKYGSMYDPIREEPQFIALVADFDRNAAEQRKLLQAMNAN